MAKILAFAFLLAGNVEKIDFAGFGIGGWVVECEKLLGRSFGGWWGGVRWQKSLLCAFSQFC